MRNNGVIVVSGAGVTAMKAREEFERQWAKEHGATPFWKRHNMISQKFHTDEEGYTSIDLDYKPEKEAGWPTDKEIADFIEQRETYVAIALLEKNGWEPFRLHCINNKLEHLLTRHTPCESADGQCHMDCYMLGECHP